MLSSSVEFEILLCNITLALSITFIEHWAYGGGGGSGVSICNSMGRSGIYPTLSLLHMLSQINFR